MRVPVTWDLPGPEVLEDTSTTPLSHKIPESGGGGVDTMALCMEKMVALPVPPWEAEH